MSNAAVTSYPVAQGATARALPGISPGHRPGIDQPRKSRTPLSLVRSVPRKRRAPFVVLCFGLLAIALMAVLVLNISVSSAQYQLVQLRSEQTTLTKQNQDLTQQVQNFGAPQNLAAKATELGMVASLAKGQIDLSTLSVTGKAKPAVKDDAPGSVIAAPAVAGAAHRCSAGVGERSGSPSASRRTPSRRRRAGRGGCGCGACSQCGGGQTRAAPRQPLPRSSTAASVPAPAQKVPGQ